MAPEAPPLPKKFPCWCRAVYSWGGETKRDLGFVEGDLIECLNAGDGQWWMGRLRRDRRMMGLFPSNFVTVLGEDFVPGGSRSVSPLMLQNGGGSQSQPVKPGTFTGVPKKQKTVFRKPFQAHKEAIPPSSEASRGINATVSNTVPETPPRDNTSPKNVQPLRTPATAVKQSSHSRPSSRSRPQSRAISPRPHQEPESSSMALVRSYGTPSGPYQEPEPSSMALVRSYGTPSRPPSRAISPRPFQEPEPSSMALVRHYGSLSQPPSPSVSPGVFEEERGESPPPPPPPPHRVAVKSQSARDVPPPLEMTDRYNVVSRTPSPIPPSPEINGHTPSPLRDAMEDVMSSLQDMGLPRDEPSTSLPTDFVNPWSPDSFDRFRDKSPSRSKRRPLTSLGLGGNDDRYDEVDDYENNHNALVRYHDGPPQINNYVQRMESRLRQLHAQNDQDELHFPPDDITPHHARHHSVPAPRPPLRSRRSAYDLLNRSYTNKSSATTSSSGVQSISTNGTSSTGRTSQSLMSGTSAGGFSATSAGSYARRGKMGSFPAERPNTSMDTHRSRGYSDLGKVSGNSRSQTPLTGISYHSSHNTSRQGATSAIPWSDNNGVGESAGVFGGLSTPKTKKNGFFKKIIESARTGAANARSSIAVGQSGGSTSQTKAKTPVGISSTSIHTGRDAAREMGLSTGVDWVQVRRDVNRATTPSRNERIERAERCQMMDHPVIYAVEELYETAEGDEGIDGLPLSEPTNWGAVNLSLVDKSARFISSLPPMTNPTSLAQGYVCRPHKSDVQRLRAIFTWVSEKIVWDEPIGDDDVDMRRVIQTKRGTPQEVAILVKEMCAAVGLHADVVRGFLKTPGEYYDMDNLSQPNHWWNAVLVDGEWRIMDCSLASPTNPKRNLFVSTNTQYAEGWYFLARPLEACYTHIPLYPEEQHICPPISPDVLLALPAACPPFFKNGLQMPDYDTSLIRIEGLEVMQIRILVPADVECAAEVEAPAFARDADGDYFENGDVVRKRVLVQPDWIRGQKRFTIKAILPGDEGRGVLKIYAGKKGLMHSSRDIPHPLALALPIIHTGENPPYDFVLRHPTPHAQRHDLYVMQPQCARLAINNTFVFAVRQHPSSLPSPSATNESGGRLSPSLFGRPASALSMVSSTAGSNASTISNEFSASTSAISTRSSQGRDKPAKLAIQSPSGKILRLTRKADHMISTTSSAGASETTPDGTVWETVIKIGERGIWRGLVLADRTARWCVFCEWECV